MRIVWTGAVAALTVAGAFAFSGPDGRIDPMTVSAIAPAPEAGRLFRLQVDGREGGCLVEAGADDAARRPLSISPACAAVVPGLAGARWWLDRADGSVAFMTDDGRVAAEFALADGAAFESYAPRQPIMTLLSR